MSNKKENSVEWLFNRLVLMNPNLIGFGDYLEQAKEMHEDESFQTFKAGQESMEEGGKGFDQWYQKTFGGHK